jgi:hypothetical protein
VRIVETSPRHDELAGSSVTYQRRLIQCGKAKCRKWHGPYWYAFWTAANRTRTLYVGKKLRSAVEVLTERHARREQAQQESHHPAR